MTTYDQQAAELILQDLVDCLFVEQFFGDAEQALFSPDEFRALCQRHAGLADQVQLPELPTDGLIWQWSISRTPLHCVLVPVVRGFVQALHRIPGTPVFAVQHVPGQAACQVSRLDPVALMELVIAHVGHGFLDQNKEGAGLFLQWLKEALRQTAWSMAHNISKDGLLATSPTAFFQRLEQISSLRDRPFHPVAKAKKGFTQQEYHQYMAEFGQAVQLHWMAVDKRALMCGTDVSDAEHMRPEQFLLSEPQQAVLREEMRQRGIDHTHVAIPVHPWQWQRMLPKQLAAELQSGVCVSLDFQQGSFLPTSSVRSLAPETTSPHYLKLPLGMYSLGASRYLPAIKMINGQRSEALLQQALALDSELAQRVFICNERKWWAYMPEHGSLFDEAPRHLSAMVRSYPASLMQDPDCRLVPMAALGVSLPEHEPHVFDEWLCYRQLAPDAASVLILFRELCEVFLDINLRLFRLGMLAEVHGQNAVLVWRAGKASGLLLRDHDSLRVHVPWLERQGLSDPEYQLRPGHANTLYHATPEDLLFYLQTLGIQVNLRAIIEVVARRYRIPEHTLWSNLRQVLERVIDRIGFSTEAHALLHQRLFHAPRWPLKLLVRPMIERAAGPGSMPFGKSETCNPFQRTARAEAQGSSAVERADNPCAMAD